MQLLLALFATFVILEYVGGVTTIPLEAFNPIIEINTDKADELIQKYHKKRPTPTHSEVKIVYQTGITEESLPFCGIRQVCNKVDKYDPSQPWIERRCRCLGDQPCSSDLNATDGFTLEDKTVQYKVCEPVHKLPVCNVFKDVAWTIYTISNSNITKQIVRCSCPTASVSYLQNKTNYTTSSGNIVHEYDFACAPNTKLPCVRFEPCEIKYPNKKIKWHKMMCIRKEPCMLFSVRKRPEDIEEVKINEICECDEDKFCPNHHLDDGVNNGTTYVDENISTFSGHCVLKSLLPDDLVEGKPNLHEGKPNLHDKR